MLKSLAAKWRDRMGMMIFHGARILETIFPPIVLRGIFYPAAAILAWRDVFSRGFGKTAFHHLPTTWPPVKTSSSNLLRIRIRYHLSRVIANWPDRLGTSRWRSRFNIEGNYLKEAVARGTPVILVSAHFGPLYLGGYFLRAFGFRVATYVGNANEIQFASRRAKDRLSHFPEIPHVFSDRDSLRDVYRFLEQGNILRTAFDVKTRKMIQVPFGNRSVRFATGSIRLAAAIGATLIPYVISENEPWKFRLHLGQPVPSEFLTDPSDVETAAAHIVKECCRFFQFSPDEMMNQIFSPPNLNAK